jgi:radical SAM superfamily enzyme YgiQ (UPF0313 family)
MYARADTVVRHPDLFQTLKESGLEGLTIGIESFKDEDLKDYNKKTTVEINNDAIRILKKLGININAHIMVRSTYTDEDFQHLLKYVNEKSLFQLSFPVLTPLPGTELYEQNVHRFAIRNYDYFDFLHSILPTALNRKDFYRQFAALYRKSYSLRRYINFKLNQLLTNQQDSKDIYTDNTDGITLLVLIWQHIFAIPLFFKLKNAYKTECSA